MRPSSDPVTEELIDGRIDVHDSTHFELKLDYSIDTDREDNRYRVESYFFVPRSLGINATTYPREQFYADVQAYIRRKTPSIPLTVLADARDPESPLHQIVLLINRLNRGESCASELSYQLRLFGCVARAKLRDLGNALRDQVQEMEKAADIPPVLSRDLQRRCASFLDQVVSMMAALREVRADLIGDKIPRAIVETFEFVDEYLSLIVENKVTALVRAIDESVRAQGPLAELRERTRQLLVEERAHRTESGYASVLVDGSKSENEHYVYRRGMLKKFVMSVLWLEIAKEKEGNTVANLGAAVAAGIAMAFALMATVLHSQWYMINTAGFVVGGTLVYMLKDRIKEWMRVYLSSRLAGWLADYSVRITDPDTRVELGRCRETFAYMSPHKVPEPVYNLRHLGERASIEVLAKPEVVLRYQKDVVLKGREIVERMHLEDYDINDIIRFGLRHFLVRADDPEDVVPTYDPHRDRVERRRFPKVYHLNVVLVFRAESAPDRPHMRRIRVIFNKKGIRRIENVV